MQSPLSFTIAESSQVGQARRTAISFAAALGFDEIKQGVLALIVTEVANNMVRHASEGELFLRVLEAEGNTGIELTAVDKGPGMASVSQSMQDGHSTAGTAGNGMGAMARLSDRFEVYSIVGEGTVVVCELWAKPAFSLPTALPMEIGAINRPKPGQEVCGDFWGVAFRPNRALFFLADGLGHGPDAGIASQEAVRAFRKHAAHRPKEVMEAVHLALQGSRGTRGVAAALAEIDFKTQQVVFAGVGNVAGTVFTPTQSHNMVSHNGIVGHQVRKVQEFDYPWTPQSLLILHSDGLSQRWQLERYPGLTVRHPSLIAGVLYRDFQRQNDDATVLVGRMKRDP